MSQITEKNYWAFISYSSLDNKTGSWLHKKLENYSIPNDYRGQKLFDGSVLGKNLRPVFRDRDELSGAASLGDSINKALKSSKFLVVLCSKNSAKSEWVNKEIEAFRSFGKEGNILALILNGEPNATSKGRSEDECFPPALRYPAEPIAGDLRKDGDGKDRGFLKILAGVTQLDFDVLYRRHEKAQAKRRALIMIISTLLLLILSSLTAYAFIQRDIARDAEVSEKAQREKAISAQIIAEDAQKQAEEALLVAEEERTKAVKAQLAEKEAKNIAEEATIIALENEKDAKSKYREVVRGKYQSAKDLKNIDQAIVYLSELIRLYEEDGIPSGNLKTLLSIERANLTEILWRRADPIPEIESIFDWDINNKLLWDNQDSLWFLIFKDEKTLNGELKQIFPQFKNIQKIVKVGDKEFIFLDTFKLYYFNEKLNPKLLIDLKESVLQETFDYNFNSGLIHFITNTEYIVTYSLDNLQQGIQKVENKIKTSMIKGTTVYDIKSDIEGKNIALKINEEAKRRFLVINIDNGKVVKRLERQPTNNKIIYENGEFILCCDGDPSQIISIKNSSNFEHKVINVPTTNADFIYTGNNRGIYITDQSILTKLDLKSDKIIDRYKIDTFWGDTDMSLVSTDDSIFVSSSSNLEVRNNDSPFNLLSSIHNFSIKKILKLKDGLLLFTKNGWEIINSFNGKKLVTGKEFEGIITSENEEIFMTWNNNTGYVYNELGELLLETNLNGKTPLYITNTMSHLVYESDKQIYLERLNNSDSEQTILLSENICDISIHGDHIYSLTVDNIENSLKIEKYSLSQMDKLDVFYLNMTIRSRETLHLATQSNTFYWYNGDGDISKLNISNLEELGNDLEIETIPVLNKTGDILPIDNNSFWIESEFGDLQLYEHGVSSNIIKPFDSSLVLKVFRYDSPKPYYIFWGDNGQVISMIISDNKGHKSIGNDSERLTGNRFEAIRNESEIILNWSNDTKTKLSPDNVGVDGYKYIAQNSDQSKVAAVENEQNYILVWDVPYYGEDYNAVHTFGLDERYGLLKFVGESDLVVGIDDGLVMLHVDPNQYELSLTKYIKVPDQGIINTFAKVNDRYYFTKHGNRYFMSTDINGNDLKTHYSSSEVWALEEKDGSLYIGHRGSVEKYSVENDIIATKYLLTEENLYSSWNFFDIVINHSRDLLFFTSKSMLYIFQESSGEFIGGIDQPEIVTISGFFADKPDSLYLSGGNSSIEIIFNQDIENIDNYIDTLPYVFVNGDLIMRKPNFNLKKESL